LVMKPIEAARHIYPPPPSISEKEHKVIHTYPLLSARFVPAHQPILSVLIVYNSEYLNFKGTEHTQCHYGIYFVLRMARCCCCCCTAPCFYAAGTFWYFLLTIQNTANRQVKTYFLFLSCIYLVSLARCAPPPHLLRAPAPSRPSWEGKVPKNRRGRYVMETVPDVSGKDTVLHAH